MIKARCENRFKMCSIANRVKYTLRKCQGTLKMEAICFKLGRKNELGINQA